MEYTNDHSLDASKTRTLSQKFLQLFCEKNMSKMKTKEAKPKLSK